MSSRAPFLVTLVLAALAPLASAAGRDPAKPLTEEQAKQVLTRENEFIEPILSRFDNSRIASTCRSALARGHDLYSCFMYAYVKSIEQKTRLTTTGHMLVYSRALTVLALQKATFKKPEQLKTSDLEFAEVSVWLAQSALLKRVKIPTDEEPTKHFVTKLISAIRMGLGAFERDSKNAPPTAAEIARKADLERMLKRLEALN